jgi:hypothetical protein
MHEPEPMHEKVFFHAGSGGNMQKKGFEGADWVLMGGKVEMR